MSTCVRLEQVFKLFKFSRAFFLPRNLPAFFFWKGFCRLVFSSLSKFPLFLGNFKLAVIDKAIFPFYPIRTETHTFCVVFLWPKLGVCLASFNNFFFACHFHSAIKKKKKRMGEHRRDKNLVILSRFKEIYL